MGSLQQIFEQENQNGYTQSPRFIHEDYRSSKYKPNLLGNGLVVIFDSKSQSQIQSKHANYSSGSSRSIKEAPRSNPTNQQIRDYHERNSMASLLGISKKKRQNKESQASSNDFNESGSQQKQTSRSQFYSKDIQAQANQSHQRIAAPQNVRNSTVLNANSYKNRPTLGRLPSEFNVEITTKWIPKSALAKMNLPDNFILENTNTMMNIAALSKNPKGEVKSTNREAINLKDAFSTKKQSNLGQNDQESKMRRKAESEWISIENEEVESYGTVSHTTMSKQGKTQEKQLFKREIKDDQQLESKKDTQQTERKRVASAQQFRQRDGLSQSKSTTTTGGVVRPNLSRKNMAFAEFSKIGPARSITSLQTRTNFLFNHRHHNSAIITDQPLITKRNQPMEIYKEGVPIGTDITQWRIIDNTSIKHNGSALTLPQSKDHVQRISQAMSLDLEKETTELSKQFPQYTIRSNLDNIVQNIRKINLTRPKSSFNSARVLTQNRIIEDSQHKDASIWNGKNGQDNRSNQTSLSNLDNDKQQHHKVISTSENEIQDENSNSLKNSKDLQHKTTTSANLIKIHPKNHFFSQIGSEGNKRNKTSEVLFDLSSSRISQSTNDIKIQREDPPNLPSATSIFSPTPSCDALTPGFNHKFIDLNCNEKIDSEEQSSQKNSVQDREIQKSKQKQVKFLDRYQILPEHLRMKFKSGKQIPFIYEKSHQKDEQNQPNIMINKDLTMKAYQKAIGQIRQAEFEDEKYLFDPKSQERKRKRNIKEKLLAILLRCARMHLKTNEIETVSRVSTVPYQNKGSFFFLESVKKNQIETVQMLIEKNKCFISDFDQFNQTGLHYACKKGYFDMAKLLIDKGADMDAVDSMNRTPLFYALINEDKPLIKEYQYNSLCQELIQEYYNKIVFKKYCFLFVNQELLCRKCSPWSGDSFAFLKQNLSNEIWNILKYAKGANIQCKLTNYLQDRDRLWEVFRQTIRNM